MRAQSLEFGVGATELGSVRPLAMNRARRSKPLVRELLDAATIEGLAGGLNAKVAAVSFRVPQLGQTWYQLLPWEALEGERPGAIATIVAWSLRESIRRYSAIEVRLPERAC